eukprot:scaffold64073_cov57-Phaeocystis_antarctica.AAC.1
MLGLGLGLGRRGIAPIISAVSGLHVPTRASLVVTLVGANPNPNHTGRIGAHPGELRAVGTALSSGLATRLSAALGAPLSAALAVPTLPA